MVQGPSEVAAPCGADNDSAAAATATAHDNSGDGFTFEALLPSDSLWMVKDITWSVAQLEDSSSNSSSNASNSSSSSRKLALQSIVDATNGLERLW
jgi:hypothetical protein